MHTEAIHNELTAIFTKTIQLRCHRIETMNWVNNTAQHNRSEEMLIITSTTNVVYVWSVLSAPNTVYMVYCVGFVILDTYIMAKVLSCVCVCRRHKKRRSTAVYYRECNNSSMDFTRSIFEVTFFFGFGFCFLFFFFSSSSYLVLCWRAFLCSFNRAHLFDVATPPSIFVLYFASLAISHLNLIA